MALLEDTAQMMLAYPTIPCNDCKYCMPCPYGLDIPAILLHYNRCVNEGNVPKSSQDEHYREARRAFLIGYDRSVPKLRQASHCTDATNAPCTARKASIFPRNYGNRQLCRKTETGDVVVQMRKKQYYSFRYPAFGL